MTASEVVVGLAGSNPAVFPVLVDIPLLDWVSPIPELLQLLKGLEVIV